MPKVRRSRPKVYVDNSTSAIATLIFSTLASQTWFGSGGYSFVLENTVGYKLRIFYSNYTNISLSGFFKNDSDLQPRYYANNEKYYTFNNELFFGSGWDNDPNGNLINLDQPGAMIRIDIRDINSNLSSNNTQTVSSAVSLLVERTVRAINYAEEINITANNLTSTSLSLSQNVKGSIGNTNIFRGYTYNENNEGSFFDVLTPQIQTINFENGQDISSLQYYSKSGSLSNAEKKALNDRSFEIGTLPVSQYITGKKLQNLDYSFDDSTTFNFVEQKINPRLGIPYYPLSYINQTTKVEINEAVIVNNESTWNLSDDKWVDEYYFFNDAEKYPQRRISNTPIFSYPNKFSDFEAGQEMLSSLKSSILKSKNIDNYLEKQNVSLEYEPFDESSKMIDFDDSNWQISNNNEKSYHVKNSKQIKLDINFKQSSNAFLINTANTKVDNDFLTLDNNRTVTRYTQNTAYWNFTSNRWEYIDIAETRPGSSGFKSESNYSNILPINSNFTLSDNVVLGNLNLNNDITRNSKLINNITTPSFRPHIKNSSNLMQVTKTSGFPNDYRWKPNADQTLKMSDYISTDFMLEKVLIKCKVKTSLKVNSNRFTDGSVYDEVFTDDNSYYGLSFFFLRNNKILNSKNNKKIENIEYYLEAKKDHSFDPNNITGQRGKFHGIFNNASFNDSGGLTTSQPGKVLQFVSKTTDYIYLNSDVQDSTNPSVTSFELNNQIDLHGDDISKFYYLVDGSLDDDQNKQIRTTDTAASYSNNNYESILNIESISSVEKDKDSFRDIISLTNVIFAGADISSDFRSLINSDNNIDLVVDREKNELQSLEVYANLKRSNNSLYTDESIFFDELDESNTFIFEGKSESANRSRIFNTNKIGAASSRYNNLVDYTLISQNQDNIIEKYNYLLKPEDEIIFGVSSYANGNLISTMTELYDSIEIVLIGKEIGDTKNSDHSKSVRKVITPQNNIKSNKDVYTNLKTEKTYLNNKNSNKAFTKNAKKSLNNTEKFVYDSSLPNFLEMYILKNKKIDKFYVNEAVDGSFAEKSIILSNVYSSDQITAVGVVERHLFYNEVYNNFVFEEFKDNVNFSNRRLSSESLVETLYNNIDLKNVIGSNGDISPYDVVKTKTYIHYHNTAGFNTGSDSIHYIPAPLPLNNMTVSQSDFFASESQLYTTPYFGKSVFDQSAFGSVLDIENKSTYNFKKSDANYSILHNVLEANAYQAPISLQRNSAGTRWYLVLHNTPIGSNNVSTLIDDFKTSENFVLQTTVKDSLLNSLYNVPEGVISRHTFPLTLRSCSFIPYNSSNSQDIVGYDENKSFTKEFMYYSNEAGNEFLFTELDYFEMSDYITNYNSDLSNSNRTGVKEIAYTNMVNSTSFISLLIDEMTSRINSFEANYTSSFVDYNDSPLEDYADFKQTPTPIQGHTLISQGFYPLDSVDESQNSLYQNIINDIRESFSVKFYLTGYQLKSDTTKTPSYKFNDNKNRLFTDIDKRIKNYYHHFIDKKLLETNFFAREYVHSDLESNANLSSFINNNEFIYFADLHYIPNSLHGTSGDKIKNIKKIQYAAIFKYKDYSYNDIIFPHIKILSIIDKKHAYSNFKPGYESIILELPADGYVRIYEPSYFNAFKENLIFDESLIPYFEINLADLTRTVDLDSDNVTFWSNQSLIDSHTAKKFVIDSSNSKNWDNPNSYLNYNLEDENLLDENLYSPWGSNLAKSKNINDLMYTYGNKYNNFPFNSKKGYIYGIQNSSRIEESTYFETYRYGHFSDHIKYTQSHVTVNILAESLNVNYTVEKKYYNESFQTIIDSDELNLTQNFNKNIYAQSNFPYIEDRSNLLSQLNVNNARYNADDDF